MDNSNTNLNINITEDVNREIICIFGSGVVEKLKSACKDHVYYTYENTLYNDVTICVGIGTDFSIECDNILSKIQYGLTAESFANIIGKKYRECILDAAIREAFY